VSVRQDPAVTTMIAPDRQLAENNAGVELAGIEALFAEARRRRRRRWMAGVAGCLVLGGAVVVGVTAGGAHYQAPRSARSAGPAAAAPTPRPLRLALPPARLAWVDYQGQLHIGNVATRYQRAVATVPSANGGRLVAAGHFLYWPDTYKNVAPIRGYDIATGKIRYLPRGQSVFASAGGRRVYITRTSRTLIELPAGGSGPLRLLRVPPGWSVTCCRWQGTAAGGIVVYSASHPVRAATWSPRTGAVTPLGPAMVIDDSYTPPGAGYSLIAWTPASCAGANCPLKITNTATSATLTVPSPLHHGFTAGDGVFSPNGRWIAVFARRASLTSNWPNHSELAIINTRTGKLRLDRAAKLLTQEDAGWAVWLPGGRKLLAGALSFSYAVAARTLATRPFFFFPGTSDHNIMDTPDINFSTVLIP
jgi:hypothetical protein